MPNLYILLDAPDRVTAPLKEPGVLLIAGSEIPDAQAGVAVFSYNTQHIQTVYREVQQLFCNSKLIALNQDPVFVPVDPGLLQSMRVLGDSDSGLLLRLVLSYCLTVEKDRCSALLRLLLSSDADLFDFIHRHRLEAWPVNRYAELIGLPLRKFNQLFKDKFGMSAKHWLHHQRLEHARYLLETTHKKIIDVAFESGFCNSAHFSDSFRRHFCKSPSEVRRDSATRFSAYPSL